MFLINMLKKRWVGPGDKAIECMHIVGVIYQTFSPKIYFGICGSLLTSSLLVRVG